MPDQGATYAAFIEFQLKEEFDRKAAIEGRALAIAGQSSAFLGLTTAVTALIVGQKYQWSQDGARGLAVSLFVLSAAILLGLLAYASKRYDIASADTLRTMTTTHWTDHDTDARNAVAAAWVKTIESLRPVVDRKARLVVSAFYLQLSALLGLVVTVGFELRNRVF